MRVAICQMRADDDVERNLDSPCGCWARQPREAPSSPRCPSTSSSWGRPPRRAEVANEVPGPVTQRLGELARARSMWVLAGGVLESAEGRVHDTSVLLAADGEVAAAYRKIHLYDVELPDQPPIRESDTIAAG